MIFSEKQQLILAAQKLLNSLSNEGLVEDGLDGQKTWTSIINLLESLGESKKKLLPKKSSTRKDPSKKA